MVVTLLLRSRNKEYMFMNAAPCITNFFKKIQISSFIDIKREKQLHHSFGPSAQIQVQTKR